MPCTIDNLLHEKTPTIEQSATVSQAAELMSQNQAGWLIVTHNGEVAGLFTESDLLNKIVSKGLDSNTERLEQHCTRDLITIDRNSSCQDAAHKMRINGCRRLLVYNREKFVGTVQLREVAHGLARTQDNKNRVANIIAGGIAAVVVMIAAFLVYLAPAVLRMTDKLPLN